jgi:hypothetical protein
MKDPWEAFSVWIVKAAFFVAVVTVAAAAIVGLWAFTHIVRFAAHAFVGQTGTEPWEEPDEQGIRIAGSIVGGVLGFSCMVAALAILGTPPLCVPIGLAVGGALGFAVAPEEHDPWRALPVGRFISDDWGDDIDVS